MDITEFLPKYPDIERSNYPILNTYDVPFNEAIYRKREFYENKLSQIQEPLPRDKGIPMKYQKTIARYMSSYTPYNSIILIHSMGSGKTCSAIGAIEQIMSENPVYKNAYIFTKGEQMYKNFRNELVYKCTSGKYIPKDYEHLTKNQKVRRVNDLTKFYVLRTFETFAKELSNMKDIDIKYNFSNCILVLDEIHNIREKEKKKGELDIYSQFHRLLHLTDNCKTILLTGTPIKDSPDEIASVANLLLPLDKQFPTGSDFYTEYLDRIQNSDRYIIKPEKEQEFKDKLRGRVSFLKETESSIKKKFIGQHLGKLTHLVVYPVKMQGIQLKTYKTAFSGDKNMANSNFYSNSINASLFVFPDSTYGDKGFTNNIIKPLNKNISLGNKSYSLEQKLLNKIRGATRQQTIDNIREYSTMYADVLSKIVNNDGIHYVYCSAVTGSGAILFSLLLEALGYRNTTGANILDEADRYAILTGESRANIVKTIEELNQPSNYNGKKIKVVVGSSIISEGYSFYNVQHIHILTPHWNYSETEQAIARGIRLGSHTELFKHIQDKQNFAVNIYQYVPVTDILEESISLYMYEISEDKDFTIKRIMRLLMETAFDCALNYMRNRSLLGADNSRACEYTKCDFKCDGIDPSLMDDENIRIDDSTYQLYYTTSVHSKIISSIEELFRENQVINIQSIIKNLESKFNKEEIESTILSLRQQSDDIEKEEFIKYYANTTENKIIANIQTLFNNKFEISLDEIIKSNKEYNLFEILTVLNSMIIDNIPIFNKYNIQNYLRENNNIYFLSDQLEVNSDRQLLYYSINPYLITDNNLESILLSRITDKNSNLIREICSERDPNVIQEKLLQLSIELQEIFIESAILAKHNNVESSKFLTNFILSYYKTYIGFIESEDSYYSKLLFGKSRIIRYFKDKWYNANSREVTLIQETEDNKLKVAISKNPFQIIFKKNSMKNTFCLTDMRKSDINIQDKRKKPKGMVCTAGWKRGDLLEIAIRHLKIPLVTPEYKKNLTEEQLRSEIARNKDLKFFTDEDLDNLTKDELRNALFFVSSKNTISSICSIIQTWAEENGYVIEDEKCGANKTDISSETIEKEEDSVYTTKILQNKDDFTSKRTIKTRYKEVYNEDIDVKFDDNILWLLIYKGQKIAGFIAVDKKSNTIKYICEAKSGSKDKEKVIEAGMQRLGNVSVVVSRSDSNYHVKVAKYKEYGFIQYKQEGSNIYFKYKNLE